MVNTGIGSLWKWNDPTDSSFGSIWKVIGPPESTSAKESGWVRVLCIEGTDYWLGRAIDGNPAILEWVPAEDPFVTFVKETLDEHSREADR